MPSVFNTMNEDTLDNSQIPMTVQRYLLYVIGDWGVKGGWVKSQLDDFAPDDLTLPDGLFLNEVMPRSVDGMAYHRPSNGVQAKLWPPAGLISPLG